MDGIPVSNAGMADQDRSLSQTFEKERARLAGFIRRRVPDASDADDVLQDVFYELVQAARLVQPIEQVGAWLFRVARNRITDLMRRKQVRQVVDLQEPDFEDDEARQLADLLPSGNDGPEAAFARRLLLEELDAALDELPAEQRDVFVAHELEGASFKELSARTGVGVNTLLARKRYAVLHLRRRLQAIHDEFTTS